MLRGLRTVGYPAPDLSASKRFFTELLGFGPYFDQPFYVGFDVRGFELGLIPDLAPSDRGPLAYWAVDDLPAAIARAEALGGRLVDPPQEVGGGIVTAAVSDPAGNRVGLIVNPAFRAELGSRIAATLATTSDRSVVARASVAATPEAVWELWTSSEGLARWLVPQSRVELKVGGPYETFFRMDAPPGLKGGEDNVVLAFLAPRMLAFSWNAPPELPTRDDHTQVLLELAPVPGGTEVTLTHSGWPAAGLAEDGGPWPKTLAYFERAWPSVLEALADHCGRLQGATGA